MRKLFKVQKITIRHILMQLLAGLLSIIQIQLPQCKSSYPQSARISILLMVSMNKLFLSLFLMIKQ
nr:MAG TPA: hypothetical protein [Caudoviricetes sp.]